MSTSHDNFFITTLIDRASGESARVKDMAASVTSRLSFSGTGTVTTTSLGLAKIYAYTGVVAVTLEISADLIALGTPTTPYLFYIKDEGGNAGLGNITVSTEGAALIDGIATATIVTDSGSLTLYSNGTDLFTIRL